MRRLAAARVFHNDYQVHLLLGIIAYFVVVAAAVAVLSHHP